MKFTLTLLALVLCLTGCGRNSVPLKTASDLDISQKLAGSWIVNIEVGSASTKGVTTFMPNGMLLSRLTMVRTNDTTELAYEGAWMVRDANLLTVITNSSRPDSKGFLGRTNHLTIVNLDDQSLQLRTGTGDVYLHRK